MRTVPYPPRQQRMAFTSGSLSCRCSSAARCPSLPANWFSSSYNPSGTSTLRPHARSLSIAGAISSLLTFRAVAASATVSPFFSGSIVFISICFESYRCTWLCFYVPKLVEGINDGFQLHGNFHIGLFLLVIDVVLVVKYFLNIGVQLVNFMGKLLNFQVH